jgi:hypothetical protein
MELASAQEFKSDLNNLPYFFSTAFAGFLNKSYSNSYLLFYSKEHNALMPVNRISVKVFRLLQIIYPPVTLSGERLSAENEKKFLNDFAELVKKKAWAFALYNHTATVCLTRFRIRPNHAHLEHTF